jgi:hypothetical protein
MENTNETEFDTNKKCCANCKKDWSCPELNIETDGLSMKDATMLEYEFSCDHFESKYIQYPISVDSIDAQAFAATDMKKSRGKFVKIRPCAKEYGGKTYLGLYLGELPAYPVIKHNRETQALTITTCNNPAIWVFDLNKIVFGYESFWGVIKDESELKDITDEQIDSLWYIKALKQLENI